MSTSSNLSTNAVATEHFEFGTGAADLKLKGSRDVKAELSNKPSMNPQAVIDAFEQSRGIVRPTPKSQAGQYEYKNIILNPQQTDHQEKLNTLMNDPNYVITMWNPTWTQHGEFLVFVVYGKKKEPVSTTK